jgi:D-glutamate cyclase
VLDAVAGGALRLRGAPAYSLHAFPPRAAWTPAHDARLAALAAAHDHTVAIERAGAAADGSYYTMSGKCMDAFVAPLDALLTVGCAVGGGSSPPTRTSTGIGDGGNEAGMGRVHALVTVHIRNGPLIACATPADALVTVGVSNWGGWALVAAAEAVAREEAPQRLPPGLRPGGLLPDEAAERAVAAAMIATGARDGITGALDGSVDGLPLDAHLGVLASLAAVLVDAYGGRQAAAGGTPA